MKQSKYSILLLNLVSLTHLKKYIYLKKCSGLWASCSDVKKKERSLHSEGGQSTADARGCVDEDRIGTVAVMERSQAAVGALEDAGKENSLGTEIQTANSEWSVPIAHTSKDGAGGRRNKEHQEWERWQ